MLSDLFDTSEDSKSSNDSYRTEFFSESHTDLYNFPRNKIALQFSESTTSKSKRYICKMFWKSLDEDDTFNVVMEHGRYINQPKEEKISLPPIKQTKPVHICQLPPKRKLEEFIRLGMDKAAFPQVKTKNQSKERACSNLEDYEESPSDMLADLKTFDERVVAKPLIKYSNLLKPPLPPLKVEINKEK